MKYTLQKPIKIGDAEPIKELTLREDICAGDLRGIKLVQMAEMPTDDLLKIIGRISGRSQPELDKLSMADLGALGSLVLDFLGGGTTTAAGKTSSP